MDKNSDKSSKLQQLIDALAIPIEKEIDKDSLLFTARMFVKSYLNELDRQNKEFTAEDANKILQGYKAGKYPTEFYEVITGMLTDRVCAIVKKDLLNVEKQEKGFTLDIKNKVWQDYKDMNMPAEFDKSVERMLDEHICVHAMKIISDDSKNIKALNLLDSYAYEALSYPTDFLNSIIDSYSEVAEKTKNATFSQQIKLGFAMRWTKYMDENTNEKDKNMREVIEWNFKDRRSLEEVRIVNHYLDCCKKTDIFDAMAEIHFYKHLDLNKAIATQNIRFLNIHTSFEPRFEDSRLTDVFCGGNLKDLNEIFSEMTKDELIDHFDTALVELVYSQGHSLNEFAEVYLGVKKTKDPFLNSLSSALKENPELSQINICSTLNPKDYDVISSIFNKRDNITFTKGTIELSDGGNTIIPIQFNKPLVITYDMIDKVEFSEVSKDKPLWKGAAKVGGARRVLAFDKGFEKDVIKTVNNLEKYEKGQKGKGATKTKKVNYS